MAKFYGNIGYAVSTETSPGVYSDVITEKTYRGDVLRSAKRLEESGQLNDNLKLTNRISVVADDFANNNLSIMKYVKWNGAYWKVSTVEIQRPRLILALGEIYNGPKA